MKTTIQATWKTGQEVVVDVVLTAHHKVCTISVMDAIHYAASYSEEFNHGQMTSISYISLQFQGHFVFSGCPIREGELPTQDCFDQHQLTFLEDLLHGANYDPMHPERAYVAPYGLRRERRDFSGNDSMFPTSAKYSYKMRLPSNLQGDLVLIQW